MSTANSHSATAATTTANTPAPETAANRPVAGILWMVLSGLLFVGVNAVVKHMGSDIPAAQSAFLRYVLGLVFLVPMLPAMLRARLEPRDLGLFGLRGIVHSLGVILWFYAMTRIPLAEVTAMNYLQPIFITLGAALFLGERLRLRRILAVAVAIMGALIVLRPGVRAIDPGHLAMLGTAITFAASYLIAKGLSGRVSPAVVVGMMSVTVTIGLAPFAWWVWVPVATTDLAWLFLVACFATAGHYAMTLAFVAAPISVTQPVTAVQLVWAVSMGALVFGEPVDGWVVLGGALVAGSVVFIALREQALGRAQARAAAASAGNPAP